MTRLVILSSILISACAASPTPTSLGDDDDGSGGPPVDAGSVCGDGVCQADESPTTCAKDCPKCGDGTCQASETVASCAQDCSTCGDAVCSGDETVTSCASDCAAQLELDNSSAYSIYYFYAWACGASNTFNNSLSSAVPSGYFTKFTAVTPGCWNFLAYNSNDSVNWTWSSIQLTAGKLTTLTAH